MSSEKLDRNIIAHMADKALDQARKQAGDCVVLSDS
jgi:hypothetical protein